jgi:hypothetical protein
MQREGREQGIIGGMREIPREELPEAFHQMISASTVRGLAIGLRIVLRGEQEEAEVGQETEVIGTEASEVIEEIEEIEVIEAIEGTEGIAGINQIEVIVI